MHIVTQASSPSKIQDVSLLINDMKIGLRDAVRMQVLDNRPSLKAVTAISTHHHCVFHLDCWNSNNRSDGSKRDMLFFSAPEAHSRHTHTHSETDGFSQDGLNMYKYNSSECCQVSLIKYELACVHV